MDAVLRQAYTVSIVNKEGVKSGIDRYYTDEHGKRNSGWYLIVEATDKDGRVQPQKIKNVENSQTSVVELWGERVPQAIYERVKADKMADGIVDDKLFSVKEKGYINDKIVMKGPNGQPLTRAGQITSW